jgi:hypothetical protein
MASQAYGPTAPFRIGTMTKNPLPKIEASGVAVEPIIFFVFSWIANISFLQI